MWPHRDLTDAQWNSVEAMFLELRARKDPRGRPAHSARAVFNASLWILSTGAAWASLPERFPDYRTCHRRFKAWFESGVVQQAVRQLYGAAGDAMCEAMTTRMHTVRAAKSKAPGAGQTGALQWRRDRPRAPAGE
jgi:transposase